MLVRKCDVVNRGLSGYNTRWAKIVLPRVIPSAVSHIAAVTVFFGANDCALEGKHDITVVIFKYIVELSVPVVHT